MRRRKRRLLAQPNINIVIDESRLSTTVEMGRRCTALGPHYREVFAGLITGFEMIADAVSFSSLFYGYFHAEQVPIAMDSLLKLCLVGLLIGQLSVSLFSRLSPHVIAVGWEAVPQMGNLIKRVLRTATAASVTGAAPGNGTLQQETMVKSVTALAALMVLNLLTAALMALIGAARLAALVSFIPETMITALFACIGYQLFTLGFDLATDSDASFNLSDVASLSALGEAHNWPRWLTALLLGILLVLGSHKVPERFASLFIAGALLRLS